MSSPPQPPCGEPEVPAGEVAGDDVGDAEPGEQDPAGRALLQLALLEVVVAHPLVLDAGLLALLLHERLPSGGPPSMVWDQTMA